MLVLDFIEKPFLILPLIT